MTDRQHTLASAAIAAIPDFYLDPENERKYQTWLRKREAGAHHATNESRATPAGRPGKGAPATA